MEPSFDKLYPFPLTGCRNILFIYFFDCLRVLRNRHSAHKSISYIFCVQLTNALNQSLFAWLFYSYGCVTTECDEARMNWKTKLRQQFKEFLPFYIYFCAQAVNSFAYMLKYGIPFKIKTIKLGNVVASSSPNLMCIHAVYI